MSHPHENTTDEMLNSSDQSIVITGRQPRLSAFAEQHVLSKQEREESLSRRFGPAAMRSHNLSRWSNKNKKIK